MITVRLTLGLALALAGLAPPSIGAQIGGVLRRAKARVQQETGRAVKCVVSDTACIKKAKAAGQPVAVTDATGKPVSSVDSAAAIGAATGAPAPGGAGQAAAPATGVKPGEGAWANYDFVPGDRSLFVEDFKSDNVGDFPRRLELKSGNMEVVEWQGGRYVRKPDGGYGSFVIPLPETLPDRFTVEFDYSVSGNSVGLSFADGNGLSSVRFGTGSTSSGVDGPVSSSGIIAHYTERQFSHARIMADGRYVKVYVNETRMANVPNANLGRANWILVDLRDWGTTLIGNITVAAGGRKLYDALAEHGRVATHGILFDVGSDQLRPESTPTLKQIGDMLTQHPELKLTIEGHTDNVGGDAANQLLSERRATAVKQYLVSNYSIDAGRLATKGFGASKPVSPNTTAEGRANNRRVELVKT